MRLFIAFAATVLLASCQFFPFLNPPSDNPKPADPNWHKGTLTAEAPTKTFTFSVTPGQTYYLNWEDDYEQGTQDRFTGDIQVSASWDIDYSTNVYQVDGGWCGPKVYYGGELSPDGVDDTYTLVAPEGAASITIQVEPYGWNGEPDASTLFGTYQIRWAKTPLPGFGEYAPSAQAGAPNPNATRGRK